MAAAGGIRIPTSNDVEAIVRVNLECWRETYAHLLPEAFFDDQTRQTRVELWTRVLGQDLPGRQIRVAEGNGRIVGFALALPSSQLDENAELELAMIYLLASEHGSGLGQQLLDAVLGDQPASLWMAEDNPRALSFYRRNRFVPTGERRLDEGFDGLAEIRLTR